MSNLIILTVILIGVIIFGTVSYMIKMLITPSRQVDNNKGVKNGH